MATSIEVEKFCIPIITWLIKKMAIFLSDYCKRKEVKLIIAGVYDQSTKFSNDEKIFFSNLIDKRHEKLEWQFIPNHMERRSYDLVDDSKIIVFIDSALGYQCYARDKKTVAFSIRSQYVQNSQLKFGWPAKLDDDGTILDKYL